ncbi:MAG: GIY-YIG nuclease family protein [Oscillatoriophycideae cyanobacterium NC_groundwater_1537_Pr4_S-0.65um_50_18]|nr:GIY-YIG nuclease family protein [Oscillatoriophycideae cyanobacterium NC_groundwater_1537_Pr4_S-0.65um_50_18]
MTEQLSLFSGGHSPDRFPRHRLQSLKMSAASIEQWKQQVYAFQQQVKIGAPIQQESLFELPSASTQQNSDSLDPFALRQQNVEFWRWKSTDAGIAALYFVIDYELPLLLYVGETAKSEQRWKGGHDCKRYLDNYAQAHYQAGLSTKLGTAFWLDAPVATRPRQQLESSLISKWRSPFNKENWELWGTPFTGRKQDF